MIALTLLLSAMTTPKLVAVTGATGRLGRMGVQRLVDNGYRVRALVRHDILPGVAPSAAKDAEPAAVAAYLASQPGVEVLKGDVTDRADVDKLLSGSSACLALHGARRMRRIQDLWRDPSNEPTHSKAINRDGVGNLIDAAKASGSCKRIVRITGKGETPWSIPSILINALGSMAKAYNYEGENLLRAAKSEVEYTIIRPGVMGQTDELQPSSLALSDDGGDLKVAPIPHSAVADLCLGALESPNAACATLTAMTVPSGEGADSWATLLAKVAPDRRAFRTDLLAEHKRAVMVGALGGGVVAALGTLVFGMVLKGLAAKMIAGIQLAREIETPRLLVGLAIGVMLARMV